jgi:hypothetical protein
MALDKSMVICEPKSFKLAFQNETAKNMTEINEEILDSVQKYAIKAVLAYTQKGRAVTFEEFAINGITEDIPEDGSEVIKVLTFDFEPDKLLVMEKHSLIPLSRLKLTVAYRRSGEGNSQPEEIQDPKIMEADDYTANVFIKVKEIESKL